ncbi:hypothetical protein Vau01_044780 [Virgisporangium aurantiacum]|uniref:Uncharacterized protein n=1 Tax=Virgisporangium aurantiacum TaxID=175570 RepID=A0A8J3Z5S3_9ACTN|nr:hypothetical protein Vau01_044780 [Virgisporangium aurantiacum]
MREPAGWRASAGIGLGLGSPVAVTVLLFAGAVAEDTFAAVIVWMLLVPPLAASMAGATVLTIDRLGWPLCRWWWAVALAPGLAAVMFVGTLVGGPYGSTPERAAGWATVAVAISCGVAVAAGRRVSVWVRLVAAVVAVGAAPSMVGFDHASQLRWRAAEMAGLPAVMPVISGYRPVAVRSDVSALQVDMAGPVRLVVWIDHCVGGCVARDVTAVGTRIFVAGGYELTVFQANGAIDVLTTLPGIDVRATSHRELARLPQAPSYRSYD